jgi:ATP-binding cassette subfamily B protein
MSLRLPVIGSTDAARLAVLKRAFGENIGRYVFRYLLAFVFMAINAGATAGTAWLIKDFVNEVFQAKNAAMLWYVVGGMLALSVLKGLGAYVSEVTLASIGNRIVADSQLKMFRHMLSLDAAQLSEARSSSMITRMTQNANDLRELLQVVIMSYGRDAVTLVALAAVMLLTAPFAALTALVLAPAVLFAIGKLSIKVRHTYINSYLSMGQVIGTLQQAVQGIRVVKAYNLVPSLTERMKAATEENRKRLNRIARLMARTSPISELLGGIAISAIILWGGYSVIYLNQQPGEFVSFLVSLMLAYEPAKRMGKNHLVVEKDIAGARLMYELLDMKPTVAPNEGGPALRVTGGEVRFDKVDFSYDPAAPFIAGLSFAAAPGKTTALVGPSGSGKSTVMALIERFWDPQAGAVLVDGQDIARVEIGSLRESIAYVSQESVLFEGSIADNIALGRIGATRGEIEDAAKAALAHDFITALPQGYDTPVAELGSNFSGGQRQRLAIARAMLRDAPIVLLDEATSALDAESEHAIQLAFDRLMRGRTTIVVAHRLSTVLNADRIFVMSGGSIVEAGRHAELLAEDGIYARLYRLQFDPSLRVGADAVGQ